MRDNDREDPLGTRTEGQRVTARETKSFRGPALGPDVVARNGDEVSYWVLGVFIGTIVFEQYIRGEWTPLAVVTAAASDTVVAHVDTNQILARFRLRCCAYVAGTIETVLEVRGHSIVRG
jgi:hypothetical protein